MDQGLTQTQGNRRLGSHTRFFSQLQLPFACNLANRFLTKIRAKLIFCDYVVFFYLGHIQSVIFPLGKQLNNALNVH